MNWGAKLENNNVTADNFELFLKPCYNMAREITHIETEYKSDL